MNIYGTLGPKCDDIDVLAKMFQEGMTGIRINLSHVMLADCSESIERIHQAAYDSGVSADILIDMRGPELRIGQFDKELILSSGDSFTLGKDGIPLDVEILEHMKKGMEVLLDDGKIQAEVREVTGDRAVLETVRGGTLTQRKSILLKGQDLQLPAVSEDDYKNLELIKEYGITGVMQPFVRSRKDLEELRKALTEYGCSEISIFAKIENMAGYSNLTSFVDCCDEVIIARGDLGNSMPLWELPHIQKSISRICNEQRKPFMVVTQMLSSMEHCQVPTRAEVSDIYNAVLDGASSLMVTGETAIGDNPVEVIKYLKNTAREAYRHPDDRKYK
ncbi:MAG: pyruvate kinase [Butyrivibrio sp.]|nr:pyruvate kinase [Butyrivibrio sp.]